jgi:hypothetical protein
LVQTIETIPLLMVTVLPLSTNVTLGPVPVPPPGMFAASTPVAEIRQSNPSDHHRTAVTLIRRFAETIFSCDRAKESRESE